MRCVFAAMRAKCRRVRDAWGRETGRREIGENDRKGGVSELRVFDGWPQE